MSRFLVRSRRALLPVALSSLPRLHPFQCARPYRFVSSSTLFYLHLSGKCLVSHTRLFMLLWLFLGIQHDIFGTNAKFASTVVWQLSCFFFERRPCRLYGCHQSTRGLSSSHLNSECASLSENFLKLSLLGTLLGWQWAMGFPNDWLFLLFKKWWPWHIWGLIKKYITFEGNFKFRAQAAYALSSQQYISNISPRVVTNSNFGVFASTFSTLSVRSN